VLNDDELINLMVSEPSWEDVIVKIVSDEGMDPWAVDIVKLSESFTNFLTRAEKLDLRIPARFILIAAILLRMKSDVLVTQKKKRTLITEPSQKDSEIIEMLSKVPPLNPPIKRVPVSSVSVDELIGALKKAFDVKERREGRRRRLRRVVERAVPEAEEDFESRINNLLGEIQDAIKDIETSVKFQDLLKNWDRKEIIKKLIPLLHLSNEGKVSVEQEELFKDIIVTMKSDKDGDKSDKSDENRKDEEE